MLNWRLHSVHGMDSERPLMALLMWQGFVRYNPKIKKKTQKNLYTAEFKYQQMIL